MSLKGCTLYKREPNSQENKITKGVVKVGYSDPCLGVWLPHYSKDKRLCRFANQRDLADVDDGTVDLLGQ